MIFHTSGLSTNVTGLPSNIITKDWIPQNDLLGHPNVKVFISHGGNNGQYEAVYHGVPMIAIPLFGDQVCKYDVNI